MKPSKRTWGVLEILLVLASGLLVLQIAAPTVLLWLYRPQAGHLGRTHFPVEGADLEALVYLPRDFHRKRLARFSLLIFLHGSGDRGVSPWELQGCGPASLASQGSGLSCVVICPVCPKGMTWDPAWIQSLAQQAIAQYQVDADRIYLSGYSMGAHGTWESACRYPELFAAVVPIAGRGRPEEAAKLRDLPVWAFHGAKDEVIPVSASEDMLSAMREAGGTPKFTLYQERGHDICTEPFLTSELWEWLLRQRRGDTPRLKP